VPLLVADDAAVVCNDGDPCTLDTCPVNNGGQCSNDTDGCDDQDACTTDWCDPDTGECEHDGECCFQAEAGGDWICDDGNPCTEDVCGGDYICDFEYLVDIACGNGGICRLLDEDDPPVCWGEDP